MIPVVGGPSSTRLLVAPALALLLVFAGTAGPASALSLSLSLLPKQAVMVGYSGDPGLLVGVVLAAGGIVDVKDDHLRALRVLTPNPAGLLSLLLGRADVRYAQLDGTIRWSATGWDATGWSATGWSATGWDGTGWSATGWDATGWSATGWDATGWSGTASDGSTAGFSAMDPGVPHQWGLGAINAPGAWSTTVGTLNRVVCVIDSGVDSKHPDLAANMWRAPDGTHGWNFVKGSSNPMDDAGHGTHVAGIAAAVTGNGLGVAGVAQARIMAVKVLDANGVGKESDAAFGLRWCADHGAHVATLSLGTSEDKGILRDGVAYALSKGLVVTAAAGNEGCACKRYPAAYPGVLAVASYAREGSHSSFSNTGSWIALSGPGENVASTYAGGGYRVGSGTSQATPFVAGTAALVWGAAPSLSGAQVAGILTGTAWDLGPAGKDASFGHGGVDAHKAVDQALAS